MLELKNIFKDYKMPSYKVEALKDVNLSFRKSEFVSILGPSGSGKTTLLNLIGGLDQYTKGDLIINGVSTKTFNDKDWDVYRNHRIGFVFQSYNLIPHQSVLGNVELALTISGISKEERIKRAKEALDKVGLSDQYYKKPNQLSGGQSQRVAIARALVNDPDILLADEPTGALDTVTSKQILDLIKEISKEKLVIMVTHNNVLAEEYSTRIIKLLDGWVIDDSNPLTERELKSLKEDILVKKEENENKKEKAKMGLWTTFLLSLNNLFSKKSRTILTSIASSIGIIGISLVLSISYGLTEYTNNLQDDMLSGNPIVIQKRAYDLNAIIGNMGRDDKLEIVKESGFIKVDKMIEEIAKSAQTMNQILVDNVITDDYIEYVKSLPEEDVAALFFDHEIDVSNNIYFEFRQNKDSAPRNISISGLKTIATDILKQNPSTEPYANLANDFVSSIKQAPDNEEYIKSQYKILDGKIATEFDEIMIVVNKDRQIADFLLAQLGYYDLDEFVNEILKVNDDAAYDPTLGFDDKFSYEELKDKEFTWYPNDVVFNKETSEMKPFSYNAFTDDFQIATNGIPLRIVGILEPKDNISYGTLTSGFYYTEALANEIIKENKDSEIVNYLNNADEVDNFESGPFGRRSINFTYSYTYLGELKENKVGYVGKFQSFSAMFGLIGGTPVEIYLLDLNDLGGNTLPNKISIYPKNLNHKDNILEYLDKWNSNDELNFSGITLTAEERESITYTDSLSIIFGMINEAINLITLALILFTSLALVVSSVMIAIITYVSVVERTNEIGVIRSLGGRKGDVSKLFIAETFMIGLTAGLLAISVTYLASWIINLIVVKEIGGYIANFPWHYALLMVSVSVLLSLISGLIPSRSAAKKDPVDALRAE